MSINVAAGATIVPHDFQSASNCRVEKRPARFRARCPVIGALLHVVRRKRALVSASSTDISSSHSMAMCVSTSMESVPQS
jgi:hypothetical protein